MGTESKENLGEKVGAAVKIVEKMVGTDSQNQPEMTIEAVRKIEKEKAEARKITEALENNPQKTEADLKRHPKEHLSIKEANKVLDKAKNAGQAKNVAWLTTEVGVLQHNPDAITFVAKMAEAPPQLQEDPHYLLAEGAKLYWSTPWAELSPEAHTETRAVLKSIYNRIEALREKTPDFTVDPDVVRDGLLPEARMGQRGRNARRGAYVATDENWLADFNIPKNEKGQPISIGADTARLVNRFQELGSTQNPRELSEAWAEIEEIRKSPATKPLLTPEEDAYLERVQKRVYDTFSTMNGDRLQFSPNELNNITRGKNAASERDRLFYERIKKILLNPNEETHKQINLYDMVDMDILMSAFSQAVEVDSRTGVEKKIGSKVQAHYQNLYDTILRLSDAEFWARHPAGDVENLSKTLGYFENKFAIEAMSDPFVEDMTQCMELAIKFVRDTNDGTIPGELSRYNPRTQKTYIDELTLQFFNQRIKSGAVRDYVRNPHTGIPELDPETDGRTYLRSNNAFHFENLTPEEKELRLLATLRLSKGVGIITNRTIELYAFTRTPGVVKDMEDVEGGSVAGFSSKAYGGLTRWTNPLSEWFEMYGFGDTLFQPFFNSLLGADGKPFNWSIDQCKEVIDLVMGGASEKQLKKRFGPNAGRIMDMINDFSFSGRFGPLSMWGIKDATLDWTFKENERLGGSMQLSLAETWADGKIKSRFKATNQSKGWTKRQMEEEWTRAKLGEGQWGRENQWKQDMELETKAYKTLIWAQTALRNPLGVAASQVVEYRAADGKLHKGKLKSKILNEIFTKEDLQPFGLSTDLVVERDVASMRSISTKKRLRMERIAVIDSDLGSVMRYAMNSEQFPRNIKVEDFDKCIVGDIVVDTPDGKTKTIDEKTRKNQAKEFWKKTQREIFGKAVDDGGAGLDAQQIIEALRIEIPEAKEKQKPGDINFGCIGKYKREYGEIIGSEKIDGAEAVLESIINNEASKSATVQLKDVLQQRVLVHLGTEDTQWRYLDLDTLGDRHWGRRGGDNLTRAKTIQLMMNYFHKLVGKPKMEDLVKAIAEIGQSEKGHDPKEAAKFGYLWANATADIYRQKNLGSVPFVGRLLPTLGVPMSVAQERMGVHSADYWSANNMLKFADLLGETRIIPGKRVIDGKDFGPYTMDKFRKDIGANRIAAALEMVLIGYSLAAVAAAVSATTKSIEDEKKR